MKGYSLHKNEVHLYFNGFRWILVLSHTDLLMVLVNFFVVDKGMAPIFWLQMSKQVKFGFIQQRQKNLLLRQLINLR